jgi:hypothetical protein
MNMVANYGLEAFLEGVNNQSYVYATSSTGSPGIVTLSSSAQDRCNYYGIYPYFSQTSTRALSESTMSSFNFNATTLIFNPAGDWIGGAVYTHTGGGSFLAIGLTRIPDIRLTALGLLSYYNPLIRPSDSYTATEVSRLVVLQLGVEGSG